ncbi:unnamed protein product [Closterium sp. Naga37s-1]|nr:unnamed protein product [Closterium sp. Naga37s-1]
MAGLAEGLDCDEDAGMDSSDDELDGLEEAMTGLDLLLRSLGPGVLAPRPPTAKPAPVDRVNRDHLPLSSSPDSIRSERVAPAAVSDTVVVESPITKSSAPRNFKLKQSTLSWAKPSSSTAVEQPVVNTTSSRPSLVIDISEAIEAVYADALLKYKTKWEALAAKDAAEELPFFDMVDDLIRAVADMLGRSGPRHARFMDLQEVITETSLEVQGIHSVRWLSRGDAVRRLVAVLPAVIVLLKELNSKMYALASSYRFHFFLYFLADVLEQLNILNKTFQQRQLDLVSLHAQIKRTTRHIESRYVDCGDDFGGGSSQWLSPFLERHGPGCSRKVKVEGVDSDGRPSTITFTLHDEPVDSYSGPEDHDGCIQLCTEFAERIVANLEGRLGDLDSLSGVRLFTPDAWPQKASLSGMLVARSGFTRW